MDQGGRQRLHTYPGNKASKDDLEFQRSRSNNLKDNGNESPESGSLYSDEIPSGYNSGEQYDTISCGYMSGEAYELPDTRMELREPNLEVIEECIQPLGAAGMAAAADSDDNIFRMPDFNMGTRTPDGGNGTLINFDQDESNMSSTSSGGEGKAEADSILNTTGSPMVNFNKKLRKKPLTFAVPIEASPLNKDSDTNAIYDESSDAGMGDAPTGGYRAVPSDTDTSAVDSDPNAMDGRHKRRRKKNLKNHDEVWFVANDTKFWSRFRFVLFWSSIVCMFGACILAGILIFLMPRNCDPTLQWYQGNVIMDIKADNSTGKLDLNETLGNLENYKDMGVTTLHLKLGLRETGEHIRVQAEGLAMPGQWEDFFAKVHLNNLTIIVQVPVVGRDNSLTLELESEVDSAIRFWISNGADGIFLDNLDAFQVNVWVAKKIAYWHGLLDRFAPTSDSNSKRRILMTSYKFAKLLTEKVEETEASEALSKLSLLDAHLDMDLKTNITLLEQDMQQITHWDTLQSRPWINWNLQTQSAQLSNAAIALQMLLPGTININALQQQQEDTVKNMTNLRAVAVPIYMNGNYKRCDCDEGTVKEVNYVIHQPLADTIQMERFYNRRNRYVLVANFGTDHVNLAPVGKIYAGGELVLDTSKSLPINNGQVVQFSNIELAAGEAVVIKLPK